MGGVGTSPAPNDILAASALDGVRAALHPVIEPLVDLRSGAVVGSELLLRPVRGRLARWVAGAPWSMRSEVALWALELAARELRHHPGRVHVNITPGDLDRPGFVADVERLVAEDLRPRLVFEVTESEELCPTPGVLQSIGALRDGGMSFAVDDFGEGWSNLSSVRILQPSVIKVTRSVVNPGVDLPDLATWFVDMAASVGATTVVEQIEDEAAADWARASGFDLAQGFLWPALKPA